MEKRKSRVHVDYRDLLVGLIELAERRGVAIGIPRTTKWNLISKQPGATPTIKAADALRSDLSAKLPDVTIPPPVVSVRTIEHYNWIEMGEWLIENAPDLFLKLSKRIATIKDGRASQLALGTVDADGDNL